MKNYYVLQRKIVNDPLYYLEPFTKWQAWNDMIRMVNWDTGEIKDGQEIIKLKRGEFCHTEKHLAEKWKWSRGKIRRFLTWLENDSRITVRKTVPKTVHRTGHPRIVVYLCNYQKYQLPIKNGGTSDSTPDGTPDSTETNNNIQITNSNNKNIPYEEIIESLNKEAGKKFRPTTKSFRKLINARIAEGFTLEDFIQVNKNKSLDWKNSVKMNKFLNPETLYCSKHFDTYLNSTVQGSSLAVDTFQTLYNDPLIKTKSMKTARHLFRVGLTGLTEEQATEYFEKEISLTWKEDDKIQNIYKEYITALKEEETIT